MFERNVLRLSALVVGGLVLAAYLFAVRGQLRRPLDIDESEYLHASWKLSHGEKLYSGFFEDHPGLFFELVRMTQVPDVLEWTVRARILIAIFGLFAIAGPALLAWHNTRDPIAPVIAATLLTGSFFTWMRAFADIRADAPSLALFWMGVVLLVIRSGEPASTRQAIRHGVAMALVIIATAMTPKWPLESLVIGIFFLDRMWRAFKVRKRLALAFLFPPLSVLALIWAAIVIRSSWRDYLFFDFELKSHQAHAFLNYDWLIDYFRNAPTLAFTAPYFRWPGVLTALGLMALATVFTRGEARFERRGAIVAMALVVASILEVRFVYSYPRLWPQYLLMWAMAAAVIFSMLPRVLFALLSRRWSSVHRVVLLVVTLFLLVAVAAKFPRLIAAPASTAVCRLFLMTSLLIAGVLFVLGHFMSGRSLSASLSILGLTTALLLGASGIGALLIGPRQDQVAAFWGNLRWLRENLHEGDTVLIEPPMHPIAASDASFYWYSFKECVPVAIDYRRQHPDSPLPPLDFRDLPFCTAMRDRNLRFIEVGSWIAYLGDDCKCIEQFLAEGKLLPTPVPGIFEVKRTPVTSAGIAAKEPRWFREHRDDYLRLCARVRPRPLVSPSAAR